MASQLALVYATLVTVGATSQVPPQYGTPGVEPQGGHVVVVGHKGWHDDPVQLPHLHVSEATQQELHVGGGVIIWQHVPVVVTVSVLPKVEHPGLGGPGVMTGVLVYVQMGVPEPHVGSGVVVTELGTKQGAAPGTRERPKAAAEHEVIGGVVEVSVSGREHPLWAIALRHC